MKKYAALTLCLAMIVLTISGCAEKPDPRGSLLDPTKTFVILFEKDHYPEGYSNLENDFLNISQLKSAFEGQGVPEEHFYVSEDELSKEDLESAFEWVESAAPEDALILTYVGAHGRYLTKAVQWNEFMPELWSGLPQRNKILIVDSCNSGLFTKAFEEDPASGITYGVVQANELNWWGSECENLPIVGGIWIHYFVEGLTLPEADINEDKAISFTELHTYANFHTQEYMMTHVFSNKEYLDMYENAGYYPTRKEAYPNAVIYDHIEQDIILNTY